MVHTQAVVATYPYLWHIHGFADGALKTERS